jgi:hypothetical protein
MSLDFNKIVVDPNLYYKTINGESLILVLYVDDLFLTDCNIPFLKKLNI